MTIKNVKRANKKVKFSDMTITVVPFITLNQKQYIFLKLEEQILQNLKNKMNISDIILQSQANMIALILVLCVQDEIDEFYNINDNFELLYNSGFIDAILKKIDNYQEMVSTLNTLTQSIYLLDANSMIKENELTKIFEELIGVENAKSIRGTPQKN